MLPKSLLPIKRRSCKQTPLVHQDMRKKTTFYENNEGEITQVTCKIGLWFLSYALPLINIYVCTKFIFNPFCTFQDMARTGVHYENNKWLMGDNSVNIQGRIMVLVHYPSPHCHLSINHVLFNANSSFKVIHRTRYWMDRWTDRQSSD